MHPDDEVKVPEPAASSPSPSPKSVGKKFELYEELKRAQSQSQQTTAGLDDDFALARQLQEDEDVVMAKSSSDKEEQKIESGQAVSAVGLHITPDPNPRSDEEIAKLERQKAALREFLDSVCRLFAGMFATWLLEFCEYTDDKLSIFSFSLSRLKRLDFVSCVSCVVVLLG